MAYHLYEVIAAAGLPMLFHRGHSGFGSGVRGGGRLRLKYSKIIITDLDRLILQLVDLIRAHRNTVMIGRSFKQHARPITFGFKVARWLDPLLRSKKRLNQITQQNIVLQFGGAVGILSGMQGKGLSIAEAMGKILELKVPAISSHSQNDRLIEVATTLGIVQGNISKIAEDIQLPMQTEVGEVQEPTEPGKGGSSSMSHKVNPVACIAIAANAIRIPGLVSTMINGIAVDHERGTGNWHAQWETLASIVKISAGSLSQAITITDGLEVNPQQMLANIERTNGLVYSENISSALSEHIGKEKADAIIEKACEESMHLKVHLREILESNTEIKKYLSSDQLNGLFDPRNSLGLCEELIQRVLAQVSNLS